MSDDLYTLDEIVINIKDLDKAIRETRISEYELQTQENKQRVKRSTIAELQRERDYWIDMYRSKTGKNLTDTMTILGINYNNG